MHHTRVYVRSFKQTQASMILKPKEDSFSCAFVCLLFLSCLDLASDSGVAEVNDRWKENGMKTGEKGWLAPF